MLYQLTRFYQPLHSFDHLLVQQCVLQLCLSLLLLLQLVRSFVDDEALEIDVLALSFSLLEAFIHNIESAEGKLDFLLDANSRCEIILLEHPVPIQLPLSKKVVDLLLMVWLQARLGFLPRSRG